MDSSISTIHKYLAAVQCIVMLARAVMFFSEA